MGDLERDLDFLSSFNSERLFIGERLLLLLSLLRLLGDGERDSLTQVTEESLCSVHRSIKLRK